MPFTLAYLKVPLSWAQMLRRTVKEAFNDNCLGMAAQLAYYLPPTTSRKGGPGGECG